MEEQLNDLKVDVREIREGQKEIMNALTGNEELGHRGLVQRVEHHAKYIADDKQFKQKAIGIIAGIQIAVGALLAFLKIKS
jgi:hypothetical protein